MSAWCLVLWPGSQVLVTIILFHFPSWCPSFPMTRMLSCFSKSCSLILDLIISWCWLPHFLPHSGRPKWPLGLDLPAPGGDTPMQKGRNKRWPQRVCVMAVGAPKQLSHVKYAGAEKGSSWVQGWGTHFNRCFEQEEQKRDRPTALGRWFKLTDGR